MTAASTPDVVIALIARRYARGLTQADIAKAMGVGRPTVARFETDAKRNRTPTLYTLQRYADAVGARITIEDNT